MATETHSNPSEAAPSSGQAQETQPSRKARLGGFLKVAGALCVALGLASVIFDAVFLDKAPIAVYAMLFLYLAGFVLFVWGRRLEAQGGPKPPPLPKT